MSFCDQLNTKMMKVGAADVEVDALNPLDYEWQLRIQYGAKDMLDAS